jgi:hypothetical protein
MTYEDHLYHAERERQCRALAAQASNPEIRRCHSQLAELHAGRAAAYIPAAAMQTAALQQLSS